VRLPDSGRFTPKAAQSRFDTTWAGDFSELEVCVDLRSWRTCISGLPI
jgi:hypothetical protein